jgi:hypothetical protein
VEILESQIVLFSLASWKQNNLHSLAKIGQGYICTPEVNELRLKSILNIFTIELSFLYFFRMSEGEEMCNFQIDIGYESKYEEHFRRPPACHTQSPD